MVQGGDLRSGQGEEDWEVDMLWHVEILQQGGAEGAVNVGSFTRIPVEGRPTFTMTVAQQILGKAELSGGGSLDKTSEKASQNQGNRVITEGIDSPGMTDPRLGVMIS